MDGMQVGAAPIEVKTVEVPKAKETDAHVNKRNLADEMKGIHKAKLSRKVYEDPEMAKKLVAVQASPVYNASGDLIQALSTNLGAV